MEQKERRALDKCFDDLLRDLDPSPSFLHSLYADGILTEELMDKISKVASRETQVAMLLRSLPHRGPNAFTAFKDKLKKDYPWISKKLGDELHKLANTQASINTKLIAVIERQLVPMIYPDTTSADMCKAREHPAVIIQKLSDLLTNLELKCHKSLGITNACRKTALHKLIEGKLNDDTKKEVNSNLEDLSKEVRDLKKQLKEAVRLKGEHERLKQFVQRQKDKLRDYNKVTRDAKRYKQDMEKHKLEANMLRYELDSLREQFQSQITNPFAYLS